MRKADCTARNGGGFILIYVAAILVFLTALVLHSSREVRSDAQVSARLQEYTAGRDRLIAAATLLQARLTLIWAQAESGERNMSLFTDQPVGALEIDGVEISTIFQDADLRPDANQLTLAEWVRLLGAYGMGDADSQRLAERIVASRQEAGGYQSISDLADLPNLPLKLLEGFEAASGERYPPLADLLTVGGASRRLHVVNSPLPLFLAFSATREQLDRLQEIRASREPTLADARLIFGAEMLILLYAGKPEKLRARLEIAGTPLRLEFDVSISNGQLALTPPRLSITA